MASGGQRNGLFVVHSHAGKCFADVPARGDRIRFPIGAFRVDVDQAHLYGGQWVLQVAVAAVALVAKPGILAAPVDVFFRLPDILASSGKSKRLEAHRLQRAVACQDHEVSPRNLLAVFLLNRPQQAARLVQVGVVRPAVERGETLGTRARAAAPVADAIGASAVPRHPDE